MQKILVIDDDKDLCFLLNQFLSRKGYDVTVIYSGEEAVEYLETNKPDLILCDLRLEDIDGIALLGKVKEKYPDLRVIIITGHSDIKTSALALKQGAFDYVVKPLITEQILLTIQEALNNKKDGSGNADSKPKNEMPAGEYFFWGHTESFKKLHKQVQLVGPTENSVIIYGEDGIGKKSVANEIHKNSKRSQMPFVVIKAGALSKENPGEEIFGSATEKGVLEQANGGTLFIAEAEELPLAVQEELLNVLRRKKIQKNDGGKDIPIDVRIVISSNNLLWNATRTGKFREDLYHKLNDFNIVLAPLRQRKEDVIVLAEHFVKLYSNLFNKSIKGFAPASASILYNHAWSDNVRELKNVIKKAVLLCQDNAIASSCLPAELVNAGDATHEEARS